MQTRDRDSSIDQLQFVIPESAHRVAAIFFHVIVVTNVFDRIVHLGGMIPILGFLNLGQERVALVDQVEQFQKAHVKLILVIRAVFNPRYDAQLDTDAFAMVFIVIVCAEF